MHVAEFKNRRDNLLKQLPENSIAIIPAGVELTRSRDTEFPFRQDSDFLYLTGFNEPEAVLVLAPDDEFKSILFCRNKDQMAEIWCGRRVGPERAKTDYAFDQTFPLSTLDEQLLALVNGKTTLCYGQGEYADFDNRIWQMLSILRGAPKKGYKAPAVIKDIRQNLHEMRLFKSEYEIQLMKKACEISCHAHIRAMKFAKEGATEYQLEAELHHHYAMNGARHPAYGTIVGSGDNANILHYTENSDVLNTGNLVLIDSGCELSGYAADITRTFPVSGKFSEPQKQLYQLVLEAQAAALSLYKPGSTLKQAADEAIRVLTTGMISLGLLVGELNELIESEAYKAFYMHGLGHWLGLDVHDVGDYKQNEKDRVFEPGMVLTCEPGVYVAKDAAVPEQYKGIGIRIEDDILITQDGHENLTVLAPKSIDAIEELMQGSQN